MIIPTSLGIVPVPIYTLNNQGPLFHCSNDLKISTSPCGGKAIASPSPKVSWIFGRLFFGSSWVFSPPFSNTWFYHNCTPSVLRSFWQKIGVSEVHMLKTSQFQWAKCWFYVFFVWGPPGPGPLAFFPQSCGRMEPISNPRKNYV